MPAQILKKRLRNIQGLDYPIMTHAVQILVIKWAQPQAHLLHVSASGGPPIYNNKIHWLLKNLIGIRVY